MMRRAAILRGMARAFFASAWADLIEENGQGHLLSGKEIMDLLPAMMDPAALHAAYTLAADMDRANPVPIERLYEQYPGPYTAEQWGHDAAMQAMGHGVGLWEEIEEARHGGPLHVPFVEFGSYSLERDYTLTAEEVG